MRNELQTLMEELNNMFYSGVAEARSFPVDVVEEKNAYKVYAEIPGVKKEDIKVTFEDGTLNITANPVNDKDKKYVIRERGTAKYVRDIYFGDIQEDTVSAKYLDGVLEVTITTKAPEEKPKKVIEIQ
jgi:HSP20 family protein